MDETSPTGILAVVGEHTELKQLSADLYTGMCPFHDQRLPTLAVKPSKGIYYCFSCRAHGDAARFMQDISNARGGVYESS